MNELTFNLCLAKLVKLGVRVDTIYMHKTSNGRIIAHAKGTSFYGAGDSEASALMDLCAFASLNLDMHREA